MGFILLRCRCDRCATVVTIDNGDHKPRDWEQVFMYAMADRPRLLCPICILDLIEWIDAPSR